MKPRNQVWTSCIPASKPGGAGIRLRVRAFLRSHTGISCLALLSGLLLSGCSGNAAPEAQVAEADGKTNEVKNSTAANPPVPATAPIQNVVVNQTKTESEIPKTVGMPAEINPKASEAVKEVIRLAQSGVGDAVIISYVEKSSGAFGVDAEMIVYLHDLGISDEVVLAMMNRGGNVAAKPEPAPQSLPGTAPAGPKPAVNKASQPLLVTTNYTPYPAQADAPQPPAGADPVVVAAPPAQEVSTTTFQTTLAPYGNWVTVAGYGECWQPTVAVVDTSWRPYFHGGRWLWTNHGWYWQSDYSWGWAPFHYGRWHRPAGYGWVWMPDTTWGPSWVTWRYTDSHCGWAPLPPAAVYHSGVGFTYYGSRISVGFGWGLGWNDYSFVGFNRFCDPHPWHHWVRQPRECESIYLRSASVTHFEGGGGHRLVNHGLGRGEVERLSHAPVREAVVKEMPQGRPGARPDRLQPGGGQYVVFKPATAPSVPRSINSGPVPAAPVAVSRPAPGANPGVIHRGDIGGGLSANPPDRVASGLVSTSTDGRPAPVSAPTPAVAPRPSVALSSFGSQAGRSPQFATPRVSPSAQIAAPTTTPRQASYPGQELSRVERPQAPTPVRAPETARNFAPATVEPFRPRPAAPSYQASAPSTAPMPRTSPSVEAPRQENRAFAPVPRPAPAPTPTPVYRPAPSPAPSGSMSVQSAPPSRPAPTFAPAPTQATIPAYRPPAPSGSISVQSGQIGRPTPTFAPTPATTSPGSPREEKRK